jgi:hypothetical protein
MDGVRIVEPIGAGVMTFRAWGLNLNQAARTQAAINELLQLLGSDIYSSNPMCGFRCCDEAALDPCQQSAWR